MTDPIEQALERSLRGGPADDDGYRSEVLDLRADAHVESRLRIRSPRAVPAFTTFDSLAVLVAAVVVAFVLMQGPIAGPGGFPQPPQRATASPIPVPLLTETFVSTRNGFSVRYPEGWSITAATGSWLPNTMLPFGNPGLDELKLDGVARLVVASQRLEAGQSEASWIASYGQEYFLRRCSGDRASWPRVLVDGRSGFLDLNGCPVSVDKALSTPHVAFNVIVFAGDRAYRIGLDGVVDRGYFEAILATVQLNPATAVDPPDPS